MEVFFFILSLLLLSCGTSKNKEMVETTNQTKGVIVNTDACVTIETTTEGKKVTMYPVNLDEQFQKTDLEILFDYQPSKAPQPTDCKVDFVVSVSNVSLFKK